MVRAVTYIPSANWNTVTAANPIAIAAFLNVTAYILLDHSQESIQNRQTRKRVFNLAVNATCATQVQTTIVNTKKTVALSHLIL
jgi:hypothetical protein